jgi:hypothetical protein
MATVIKYASQGPAGPTGSTSDGASIPGASVATVGSAEYRISGRGRTVGAQVLDVYFEDLSEGETVEMEIIVQGWTEGTHANTCGWKSTGQAARTGAGVSSRTSSAAGVGPGQISNNFMGPRPAFQFSDPASAVAPNTQHRFAAQVTGKAGVNVLWSFTGRVVRGKLT